jgi:hypothetical protein
MEETRSNGLTPGCSGVPGQPFSAGWDWDFLDVDVAVSFIITFDPATDKPEVVACGGTHPRAVVTQQQMPEGRRRRRRDVRGSGLSHRREYLEGVVRDTFALAALAPFC